MGVIEYHDHVEHQPSIAEKYNLTVVHNHDSSGQYIGRTMSYTVPETGERRVRNISTGSSIITELLHDLQL